MQNSQLHPANNNNQITVKKKKDLATYFGMVHNLKRYYDAMKAGTQFPERKLNNLQDLLDAHTITMAYIKAKKGSANLNLLRAMLSVEDIVAVWLFYNSPKLDVKLGNYQLLTLNHN